MSNDIEIDLEDCEHEDYEYLEVIWDDSDVVCWHCICWHCGEEFEMVLSYREGEFE